MVVGRRCCIVGVAYVGLSMMCFLCGAFQRVMVRLHTLRALLIT